MSKIWVTSDHHFGHENIIRYCGRPFKTARMMQKELIRKYTERVGKDDIVYFLGDVTMKGREGLSELRKIIGQMNGTKHLILGNHDYMRAFDYVEAGFMTVHTALDAEGFVMVHDPVASIVVPDRQVLCGHVHGLWKSSGNCLNMSVDVWDFYPVSLEDIKEYFKEA